MPKAVRHERGEEQDDTMDQTVENAVKTGFLFSLSINFYENHTGDELIEKGYNELQIECANRVLAYFETSVGSKLGKCREEMWSISPCADCDKDVDTRRFNTAPQYGVFLCKACKSARDAPRRCIDCSTKYHDLSLDKFVADPLVRRNFRFRGEPYICSWCALLKGDLTFVNERTPRRDRDKKILTSQLGLVNPRKFMFPTSEELKTEQTELPVVEWLFLPRHEKDIKNGLLPFNGKDIANLGEGFFIRYTGYVWREYHEPLPANSIRTPYFLIYHPDNPRKIVVISRIQYFHRNCQGFVETFWEPWPRSLDFRNLNPKNLKEETKILQKVSPLIFELERECRGGRPAGLPKDPDSICADFIGLCACHIFLEPTHPYPRRKDMAAFYHVNESTLHRHLITHLGEPFSTLRPKCEGQVEERAIEDLPYRFQAYIREQKSQQVVGSLIER